MKCIISFYLDYLPALVLTEKIEKAAGTIGNEIEASIMSTGNFNISF